MVADLSSLPRADRGAGGNLPESHPRFGPLIASRWYEGYVESERSSPAPVSTAYRHSFAFARCDRQLAYLMAGVERTDGDSIADQYRMFLGQLGHEAWQAALALEFGDRMAFEVTVTSEIGEGHADAVLYVDPPAPSQHAADAEVHYGPVEEVLELKTINGFGFKKATGMQGEAEGPKQAHVIQAALNAHALHAPQARVVYLSMELASDQQVKKVLGRPLDDGEEWRKFTAEWVLDELTIERYARAEIKRVQALVAEVEEVGPDRIPRRIRSGEVPKGAVFSDPSRGAWVVADDDGNVTQAGTYFLCAYCGYRERCIGAGA